MCHLHRMFSYVLHQYSSGIRLTGTKSPPDLGKKKFWIWSQIFKLLKVCLICPIRHSTKNEEPQKWINNMQVLMSQVLLVVSFFPVMKNIFSEHFAQVCSQHICTVVCSLRLTNSVVHTLYLWHTHTNTGAYVISSMHIIPHTRTHPYQIRLLLLVGSP